jgi:DNA-binding PadR family transcriptional regulator
VLTEAVMDRELLLLGLLRRGDTHGYQLHEFINRYMASCVDLKKPTAYYLLDRMTEAGWVTRTTAQEGGRPPRRIYRITAAGEDAFQRLLRENLSAHHPAHFPGDIGLAFVDALPSAEVRALLLARRAALADDIAALESAPPHTGTLQLMLEHRARHLAAELDWLDTVLARLYAITDPHIEE